MLDGYISASNKLHAADDVTLDSVLDLTDEACPMHYIKARQALRSIKGGQVLKLLISAGEDERLVGNSLTSTGFEVVKEDAPNNAEAVLMHVKKPVAYGDIVVKNTKSTAVA